MEPAREPGDIGERRRVGFAQIGGGVDVVQVGDGGPGALHLLGEGVQRPDDVPVRAARARAEFVDALGGAREDLGEGGAHVAGPDAIEGHREAAVEERVGGLGHGSGPVAGWPRPAWRAPPGRCVLPRAAWRAPRAWKRSREALMLPGLCLPGHHPSSGA